MFDFISDVLCGQRPGVVVAVVVAMIAVAEFMRFSAYRCSREEMVARISWAHGFFRLAPLVLILLIHRQEVEVSELRQIAIARGVPAESLPIAEVSQEVVHYTLTTPAGTHISWSKPHGVRNGAGTSERDGIGSGIAVFGGGSSVHGSF